MADRNSGCSIESRLEALGRAERDRLVEPDPRFLRAVREAAPPRPGAILLRRVTVLFAAAAAVVLAVLIAFQQRPAPVSPGTGDHSPLVRHSAADAAGAPGGIMTAGFGRSIAPDDMLKSLDAPLAPRELPARAADAYCAGCLEELTRI